MIEFLAALFELLNAHIDDPVPYRVDHPVLAGLRKLEEAR